MIAKISHGSSLYGVLAYNQLKVDERHADVLFTSRIIEPQGDNPYTIGHLSRSFSDYLTANRKTEKPVLHISLNPDPKDCLSEERFVSLAEEYMRCMGFGDQPYIVYRHNDIGREHLHIVSVRVDETGRAISDSYEHGRSMKVCRELERQFGLVPATPKQWKEGAALVARRLRGRQPQGAVGRSHPPARPGVAFPYTGRIPCRPFPLRHHGGRGEGGIRRAGVSRLDLFGNRQGGQQGRQALQVLRVRQGGGRRSPRKADAQRCRMGKDPQGRSPPPPPERLQPPCRPQGMTGRSSSGNSCGRVSAWYSVRMKPGASMGRPSSTMPPKPSSTAPVWARSSPQACSTTFSPGRKVFICRNPPPKWNIPPGSRSSTRTAAPKTWRPPSTSLPPYPAEPPATSPYRPEKGRKKRKYGRQQ